jgi:hypothetical protein
MKTAIVSRATDCINFVYSDQNVQTVNKAIYGRVILFSELRESYSFVL